MTRWDKPFLKLLINETIIWLNDYLKWPLNEMPESGNDTLKNDQSMIEPVNEVNFF
jgi:hypothetical protein